MRNGYREKAIACAILHHLESYLFLWEQERRKPLILMLYAPVKVIVLVWKIMENTGFILDILSAWTRTPKQLLWSGKRHGKHCSLRWLQKVQQTGHHSKETEINRFLLWDTTDKEGEATSWQNDKHVFFWWKLVKVMRQRCHSKLTEHVVFLVRRYDNCLGIGHIRFVHPHEIIEWVICSQGCFNTKFRNWFDSEVPVDST